MATRAPELQHRADHPPAATLQSGTLSPFHKQENYGSVAPTTFLEPTAAQCLRPEPFRAWGWVSVTGGTCSLTFLQPEIRVQGKRA